MSNWVTPPSAPETTREPAPARTLGSRSCTAASRRPAAGLGGRARRGAGLRTSATATSRPAAAISMNGTVPDEPPASRPPSDGPTIVPVAEQTIAGPIRRAPPSSASQAAPAVHSIPKESPYTARPASSVPRDPPQPSRQPRTSSHADARVIRRAPQRFAATPAGAETMSMASAGSASTNAEADALRPNATEIRGISGTIAVCPSPDTKNRPSTSRTVPAAERAGRRGISRRGRGLDVIASRRYDHFNALLHDDFVLV
jgi:hypothetical protein